MGRNYIDTPACPISMECCYAIIAYLYMKLYFHVGRISRYLSLYLFITALNLAMIMYVDVIVIIFILFKSVSRTILLYV